tara:strand:- start:7 stop:237 length:231 start_codon:yes stop_codon:yes gene_type:complete
MNIGKQLKEHRKLVEELLELATVITQQMNKPSADLEENITLEIGDVKFRLEQVEKYYNSNKIQQQIHYKKTKNCTQ